MMRATARFLKIAMFTFSAAFVLPTPVLAHGESEPGPHGGEIRMPGAFHVEAVAGDDALRVYLLDMQFEDPQIADSSVDAVLKQNGETRRLECAPEDGSKTFVCRLPVGFGLTGGELLVDASRGGVPGATARYELPLMQGEQAGHRIEPDTRPRSLQVGDFR